MALQPLRPPGLCSTAPMDSRLRGNDDEARSPDGARRSPGQPVDRSRVALGFTRATGSFGPWPPPQWSPAGAGTAVERGAGSAASASPSRHSREGGSPLWPFSHSGPRGFAPRPLWIPACAGMTTRQVARMERSEIRGQPVHRSRVALRSTRATGSFGPWPPPQWSPAFAGTAVERTARAGGLGIPLSSLPRRREPIMALQPLRPPGLCSTAPMDSRLRGNDDEASHPDGARRNPGQRVLRSRVALRFTRATGFFRPWPPPQWSPAQAGMAMERGAGAVPHPRHRPA